MDKLPFPEALRLYNKSVRAYLKALRRGKSSQIHKKLKRMKEVGAICRSIYTYIPVMG